MSVTINNKEIVESFANRLRNFADLIEAAIETNTLNIIKWDNIQGEVMSDLQEIMVGPPTESFDDEVFIDLVETYDDET